MSHISVTFDEYPALVLENDHYGDGFALVDLLNYFDGTTAREEKQPRPDADGDFEQAPVYADARYPVAIGNVSYTSEAELFEARRVVAGLWAKRTELTMRVVSLEGARTLTVVRNGKPMWDLTIAPGYAEFELPFKAADPRKYGELQSSTVGLPVAGGGVEEPLISPFTEIGGGSEGRVVLTNTGTTDTFPILKVTGGLADGVELIRVETGERLRLEWPINLGNVITFDFAEGQVWIDDQSPISGYLTRSQWWVLGPGETATVQFEGLGVVTGTPMLTAEWRDADA